MNAVPIGICVYFKVWGYHPPYSSGRRGAREPGGTSQREERGVEPRPDRVPHQPGAGAAVAHAGRGRGGAAARRRRRGRLADPRAAGQAGRHRALQPVQAAQSARLPPERRRMGDADGRAGRSSRRSAPSTSPKARSRSTRTARRRSSRPMPGASPSCWPSPATSSSAASRCSPSKRPTWCRRRTISSPRVAGAEQGALGSSTWRRSSRSGSAMLYEGKAVAAQGCAAGAGRRSIAAQNDLRSAESGARGGAQPAAHPRQDRRGDRRIPEQRHDQLRDADLRADRRHHRAAQGRARPIRQHRRERPGVRRSAICRPSGWSPIVRETEAPKVQVGQHAAISPCWPIRSRVFTAKINYVAAVARPEHAAPAGARHHRQPGRLLKPEMFATVTHLHRRGRQPRRGAARGA